MKRMFLSGLVGVSVLAATFQVFSGSEAALTQQSYPLVCRGGGSLVTGAAPGEQNIGFTFVRGTKPAGATGEGLAPGECSWADRAMYSNEPDRVSQHIEEGSESLRVGGALAGENRWYEELHSADSYWTFMVANNGRGQLIATSARPNEGNTPGPLLTIPLPRTGGGPVRPGRQVENPILAQAELSQIQSIGPSCTNADIASLQIRTTAGAMFSSHSSCFPYLCDTASKTCATSCADPGGCAPGMDCVGGRCVFPRAFCSDSHTSMNSRGAKNNCNAYGCDAVTGLCRTVCTSSDQCNPSFSALCDVPSKSCVIPAPSDGR